ncbi:MAG: glyoxalase/bleomycin resistance/dioxygenase family protein [Gammaproteobacteria bacterium]|nr:MAG: glyoxalase/bleomycin resistance/dioxygenase family protein [Gammaproteobacteria bacterium]
MKRFHVHVAVADLEHSIGFYTTLFGAEPSVRKTDYAKWMLDDPRLNFAISQRDRTLGVNHLGLQVDDAQELTAMRDQLERADRKMVEQSDTTCCYARSDKYWITDPQGVAWETFHTLGSVPVYGTDDVAASAGAEASNACCVPQPQAAKASAKSACCAPGAC